jgi:hypothetical protein
MAARNLALAGGLVLTLAGSIACASVTATPIANSTPAPVTAGAATTTAARATPATSAAAGSKLTIYYEENAQVEIVAPSGQRVLIDVSDPTLLSSPAMAADILLETNTLVDHYAPAFVDAFAGPKLILKAAQLTVAGIIVTGIAAAQNDTATFAPEGGSNYIYVNDIAGFRVAHFGDLGQARLTDEQLARIGRVDIAITQIGGTHHPVVDEFNRRGFTMMDQVNPRIVIPTHLSLDTVKVAAEVWTGEFSPNPSITIPHNALPAKTAVIFMGSQAADFATIAHLTDCGW